MSKGHTPRGGEQPGEKARTTWREKQEGQRMRSECKKGVVDSLRKCARDGDAHAAYLLAIAQGTVGNIDEDRIRRMAQEWIATEQSQRGTKCPTWQEICDQLPEDPEQAFRMARQAAESGLPEAQRLLGAMYLKGEGTEKNGKKAAEWTRKAAVQGDIRAQVNLGQFYEQGTGVEIDYQKAEDWYWKASKPEGFGRGYATSLAHHVKRMGKASGENAEPDVVAQAKAILALARLWKEGKGRRVDEAQAAMLYRHAAELGSAEAQCRYAMALVYEEGVEKDLKEAARWYRKAAEQGQKLAQNNLGIMYANGDGVEKDHAIAGFWFEAAALQGSAEAKMNLAERGLGEPGESPDTPEARRLLIEAAEAGLPNARCELGMRVWIEKARPGYAAAAVTLLHSAAEDGWGKAILVLHDIAGIELDAKDSIREYGWVSATPTGENIGGRPLYTLETAGKDRAPDARRPEEEIRARTYAAVALGNVYAETRRDRAIECWRKAAGKSTTAANNLADAYEKGWGVERDLQTAIELYQWAAQQRDTTAIGSLLARISHQGVE